MSPQHGDSGYGDGNPSGEALDYLGKIEACMTRKETPERSHQRIHAAGSGVTLLSCLPLGLIIKKKMKVS